MGRDDELAQLAAGLEAARKSRGSAGFIVGEAGVGKSRLAREVSARAIREGSTVLTGRAVPAASPIPYRPLVEALLSALRVSGPPDLPELMPFRGALGRLVPEWRQEAVPPHDDSVVVLGEGILRLLRVLAGERSCLVVLEDLHWADPDTLAVVEYLADNLASEPVLCLGTLRTDEPTPGIALARTLRARRVSEVIELHPLGAAEVVRMATACLEGASLPEEVTAALQNWTDGVPFLVEELLAAWVSSGALVREPSGWAVGGRIDPVVPLTFTETVRRRLAVLAAPAHVVLPAAAVLGRRFDWTLLAPVTGLDEQAVVFGLRQGLDAQLLVTDDAPGMRAAFRFRHALTRDAVLSELLLPERMELSRRALRAVENGHPELEGEWCELAAELAELGGEEARAAELLAESGRRALARGALITAEATLKRARRLGVSDAGLAVEIDHILLDVLALAGKADAAFGVGHDLLEKLDGAPAGEELRPGVHLRLARAAVAANRWPTARDHLDRARALPGAEPRLVARVEALAAHAALGEGQVEEAAELAQRALSEAERVDLPDVACEALEVLGRCARTGDLARAEAAFARAEAIARTHHLPVWRIRALFELGTIDLLSGGPRQRLEAARAEALAAGALATAGNVDLQIAAWRFNRFELDEGIEHARRCGDLARRLRLDRLQAMAQVFEAVGHSLAGRGAEMEAAIDAALALAVDPEIVGIVSAQLRATLFFVAEDRNRAIEELERGIDVLRSTQATAPNWGLWALVRTVEDRDGDAARAEVRARGLTVYRLIRGPVECAEAVALARTGRRAEAEAASAAGDEDLAPYPWHRHHVHRLVAEAAVADAWGDPVAWLREAMAFFEGAGYDRIASACGSILRRAGAPVPRKRGGEAQVPPELRRLGVTSREVEVLALVAEGLSNRDIGRRLYLSPRTVERHLGSLMTKTGTTSRTRLVAFASKRT
jgi:DNA-binding CsgD family transcriptional regulator/tetratricopeptide (TPR) repeat protein